MSTDWWSEFFQALGLAYKLLLEHVVFAGPAPRDLRHDGLC